MARLKNVDGAEKISRAFGRLSKEAAENIADALNRGAKEIEQRAKGIVPKITHELEQAIETKPIEISRKKAIVAVGVFPSTNGGNGWYARFVEFGTRVDGVTDADDRARPFLFPAFWSLRKRVKGRVNRAVSKAAKEAFRRGR